MKNTILIICLLLLTQIVCAQKHIYFIKARPIPDEIESYKRDSTQILRLESNTLQFVQEICSTNFQILGISNNYNCGVITIVKKGCDNQLPEHLFDKESISIITFPQRICLSEMKFEGDYNSDGVYLVGNALYKVISTEDKNTLIAKNLITLTDSIIEPNANSKIQCGGDSYFYYNDYCLIPNASFYKYFSNCELCPYRQIRAYIIDKNQIVYSNPDTLYNSKRFAYYSYVTNSLGEFSVQGQLSSINAFGTWLVGNAYYSDKETNGHKVSAGEETRASLWNNDWYSTTERYEFPEAPNYGLRGYTVDDCFRDNGIYSPGIMYLYNTISGHKIDLVTNEGDSQILLVDSNRVYYRVNDEIFVRSIINNERLGPPELLVKDRIVVDIHWAFIAE